MRIDGAKRIVEGHRALLAGSLDLPLSELGMAEDKVTPLHARKNGR